MVAAVAPPSGGFFGSGSGDRPRPFSINPAAWGTHKVLEVHANGGAYKVWRERALDHLSRDRNGCSRQDVRALLKWAEEQTSDLDLGAAQAGARTVGLDGDVEVISYELLTAIRSIIDNGAMARFGTQTAGGGLELWRRLHSEMQGAAPEVSLAKAMLFQQPSRASSLAALYDKLAEWEALGVEVESGGAQGRGLGPRLRPSAARPEGARGGPDHEAGVPRVPPRDGLCAEPPQPPPGRHPGRRGDQALQWHGAW